MIHTTIKKRTNNLNKLQTYLTKHKEELTKLSIIKTIKSESRN
jgi:hypothetical protein